VSIDKKDKIFSGKNSEKLWGLINQIKMTDPHGPFFEDIVWEAIYALGCKCQELEAKVDNLNQED